MFNPESFTNPIDAAMSVLLVALCLALIVGALAAITGAHRRAQQKYWAAVRQAENARREASTTSPRLDLRKTDER